MKTTRRNFFGWIAAAPIIGAASIKTQGAVPVLDKIVNPPLLVLDDLPYDFHIDEYNDLLGNHPKVLR